MERSNSDLAHLVGGSVFTKRQQQRQQTPPILGFYNSLPLFFNDPPYPGFISILSLAFARATGQKKFGDDLPSRSKAFERRGKSSGGGVELCTGLTPRKCCCCFFYEGCLFLWQMSAWCVAVLSGCCFVALCSPTLLLL